MMTRADIRLQQAEIREQYDRMAGLAVAVICSGLTISIGLLALARL